MNIQEQVKSILNNLFVVTARKNEVAKKEVTLIFQLKSRAQFKCSYNGLEVNIGDAGLQARIFSASINSSITTALIRLAKEKNIELSDVNVLIKTNEENDFFLMLRSANTVSKQIELNEFLKI